MKVAYLSHNSEVVVEALEDVANHVHKEDLDFINNSSKYYKWTTEATEIVMNGVVNHAKPKVINRNLKHANVCGSRMPNQAELYNKIAAVKATVFPTTKVMNSHEIK